MLKFDLIRWLEKIRKKFKRIWRSVLLLGTATDHFNRKLLFPKDKSLFIYSNDQSVIRNI